jgi:hypothetical protein
MADFFAATAFECFCFTGFGHVAELVAFIAECVGAPHMEVVTKAELALEPDFLRFFGAPFFEMACLKKRREGRD